MTEGKMADRASKSRPLPPPPSSRSGSATEFQIRLGLITNLRAQPRLLSHMQSSQPKCLGLITNFNALNTCSQLFQPSSKNMNQFEKFKLVLKKLKQKGSHKNKKEKKKMDTLTLRPITRNNCTCLNFVFTLGMKS